MDDHWVLPPIDDLSDASDPPDPPAQPARRAKRAKAKDFQTAPLPQDSEVRLRAILARPKCACKRTNCYLQFTPKEEFKRFQEFRTEWHGFHKLDQDRIVAWCWFVFWPAEVRLRGLFLVPSSLIIWWLNRLFVVSNSKSCRAQVFERIRDEVQKDSGRWTFLDHDVCLKSWKILHGLGNSQFMIFI